MTPLMYGELVPWYRLLDPPEDHADEAACYLDALTSASSGSTETLLELGAGAGHNALYLKQRLRCTLTDISQPMQELSRELNPECEHLLGDMRSVRLDRSFDAVFVHDAVCYMTTRAALLAAITTAFVHTRPGGVALFTPDHLRESFREQTDRHEADAGARSLRCLEWMWDPDASDDCYAVDYAFLLREGATLRAVHDHHVEGFFSRAAWLELLAEAGFQAELLHRPLEDGGLDVMFLGRRAAS